MSVEFRQRTAGEFIRMLKRRKWLIILPVITMTAAIGYVVNQLPSIYESRTLLTVKPPTIPEKVVQSLSSEDITQRLQTIQQEVLSRTTLEPMVTKYKLFELERSAGEPMEIIIGKMQKNITVELEKTDDQMKVAAFSLKYLDRSPEAARNVTAELAGKFVNAQVAASTQNAETTREFIDSNLQQSKQILDQKENERLQIMMNNVDTLPEAVQGLIAQREGLQQREETISKEKESLMMQKGRLTDGIRELNSKGRLIEDFGEKEMQDAVGKASQIEDTPIYAQLVQRRAEYNAKLENLKLTLREKHPKVIEAQNDINKVNDEIEALKKNTQARESEATRSGLQKANLQKQNLLIERQKAESEIAQINQQMQMKEQQLRQNAAEISVIDQKINASPNVKVALESVNTQYLSAKLNYDELLKKKNDATLQVDRESNAQGETIRVQDPASLPSSPVAPKRGLLTALGAAIGLALGLFLAAAFEIPRILKIQNIEDAKHYTGLPVLASVPPLLSHSEKVWNKRLHVFKVAAGIAVAVGVVPLIILALQMSRIFERMIS